MKRVTIYTDGACSGNPGPGGWAAILMYGPARRELTGACPATSNNRMELTAAIEALRALKEACTVDLHTDSEYLRQGMTDWLARWKAHGWKRGKDPVKNVDLWKVLEAEAGRHHVHWHWVRGHHENPFNERCDQLAVDAIERLRDELGEAALAQALKRYRAAGPSLF